MEEMKIVNLDALPLLPVSHDASLMKRLLLGDGVIPGMRGMSHIVLPAGASVEAHKHPDGYEVFYCIRGRARAVVERVPVELRQGTCLAIAPGEEHSFEHIEQDTELVYFFVWASSDH